VRLLKRWWRDVSELRLVRKPRRGHRPRTDFRFRQDKVPAVERDGPVIQGPDAARDVDARVPPHRVSAPRLQPRILGRNQLVLGLEHSVLIARADVDGRAAGSVAELAPVRLAVGVLVHRRCRLL